MLRIRRIEEKIAFLYPQQEIRCPVHLSIGQEACAVGVCKALMKNDFVFSGHRSHAHFIAKGGDVKKMFAEIYGNPKGCSKGRGGSMHLIDKKNGFLGATPIVGSTIPVAVGAALTSRIKNQKKVIVIFFGDGATETGVFHESLNFAKVRRLPVLFVCENNLYSVYSPMNVRQPKNRTIKKLAEGHGINTAKIDGNDVEKIFQKANTAIDFVRKKSEPFFLELSTYRWLEHCGPLYDNDIGYRKKEEFDYWKKKDPLKNIEKHLGKTKLKRMENKIAEEIESALRFAKI